MKSIFFLATSVLFVYTAFSQNNKLGENDPEAKAILDKVSVKFKTFKTIAADFSFVVTDGENNVQSRQKGVVYIKGHKYRFNMDGQEIYSDGNTVWSYDKSANEVQLTKFSTDDDAITPQRIFTDFYDKDFLYKLNGERKNGAGIIQEIELTPVDKTKTFFKILLNIDKASRSVASIKIFEKNGNRYTYTITGMQTNTAIPDATFVFDARKYPNVETVDLR